MTKQEQLQAQMETLENVITAKRDAFVGSEEDTGDEESFAKYLAVAKDEENEYHRLSRQYRVIVDAVMLDWDGAGKLMTIEDFAKQVKAGNFEDYDGVGSYSDGEKEADVSIYPSDIQIGNYRKDFTHIIWYNR